MKWGEYPAEYNKKIHGPYDPARWYGKPDTPFQDLKLGEITAWFGRRNKSPFAVTGAMSRWWWRFQHKWQHPLKPSLAGTLQIVFIAMGVFYVGNYRRYRTHRFRKYHW